VEARCDGGSLAKSGAGGLVLVLVLDMRWSSSSKAALLLAERLGEDAQGEM
jgi:hypothetical protein